MVLLDSLLGIGAVFAAGHELAEGGDMFAEVSGSLAGNFLGAAEASPPSLFMLGALRKSDIPIDRLTRTHIVTKPAQVCQDHLSHPDALAFSCSFVVWFWRELDRELGRFFGIV